MIDSNDRGAKNVDTHPNAVRPDSLLPASNTVADRLIGSAVEIKDYPCDEMQLEAGMNIKHDERI